MKTKAEVIKYTDFRVKVYELLDKYDTMLNEPDVSPRIDLEDDIDYLLSYLKEPAYNVGDYVTFKDSYEIAGEYWEDLPDDWEMPFSTCDVTRPMLEELDRWEDNQIASIDEDGDIKFEDFPYTWPVEVIAGLSPDQRTEDDKRHN